LRAEPLEDRRLLADVTVNSLSDTVDFNDGATTLREAIFATNLVAGADRIEFEPSLTSAGPARIVLTQGELAITDSLTIDGPGAHLLTIDASGNDPTPDENNGDGSRVFSMDDANNDVVVDVSIRGLALTGGDVRGRGGAIRNTENLSVVESTISGNSNISVNITMRGGGGIYSQSGDVRIIDSTVSDNAASGNNPGGGGIHVVRGTLTVTGSTISGNSAVSPSGAGQGGGIFSEGQTTVDRCTIRDNTAGPGGGGGGIFSIRGGLAVTESAIMNNSGGGILAGGSQLTVTGSTISGNSAPSGGGIRSTVQTTVISSTISGNTGGTGGGIYLYGNIDLVDSILSDNTAEVGGGIFNGFISGTITVRGSAIRSNSATDDGGGIFIGGYFSKLVVSDSTINGNSAVSGGGIHSLGSVEIVSSTISGNTAGDRGGGIFVGPGPFPVPGNQVIRHSTIAFNSASELGGGIYVALGTLALDHSIVAMNTAPRGQDVARLDRVDVSAQFSLLGHNDASGLAESPAELPDESGNLIGGPINGPIDPQLGPLANNGGQTMTHALLPGSPAINAGNLQSFATVVGLPEFDQRGAPFQRVFNARIDIGAFEYQQPSDLNLLVDTLVDELDRNFTRGDLSLREAIAISNNFPSVDTIRFDPVLAGGTILLTMGQLVISDSVTIEGLGAELLTIDASGNDPTLDENNGDGSRVFDIDDCDNDHLQNVSIAGLAIVGGDASGEGGGIRSVENLTIIESIVAGNSSGMRGGGIDSLIGNLTVRTSQIRDNSARLSGGGIAVHSGDISAMNPPKTKILITDSMITGNSTDEGGGISCIACDLTITNSTISGNSSNETLFGSRGGGILAIGRGYLALTDSAVTMNSTQGRGGGIFVGAVATVTRSNISRNSANSNGGGVAVDGGRLTVANSTISDNSSRVIGGGIYSSYRSYVTVTDSTISSNTTEGLGGGIQNGGSTLTITRSSIIGNSARNGGGVAKGFYFYQTGILTIAESTISGNTAQDKGGGIYSTYDPALLGSAAGAAYGISAGVPRPERGRLVVTGTTIDNNSATLGGGIWTGDGKVNLLNSTLSGNSAEGSGGGLYWNPFTNIDTAPTATISHSTIAFNSVKGPGGGIFVAGAALTLDHTIVARNSDIVDSGPGVATGPDLTGTIGTVFDARYSLIGTSRDSGLTPTPVGSPDAKGNLIGGPTLFASIDPLLAPLSNKGGPTRTHELLIGSPAIDRGDPAAMGGAGDVPAFDQRRAPFLRIADGDGPGGARIDIGAFESQVVAPALPGDYYADGIVDAADYLVWRKMRGRNVSPFSGANGNGDGVVDQEDYTVWRANFGRRFPAVGAHSERIPHWQVRSMPADLRLDALDHVFGLLDNKHDILTRRAMRSW
jgi:hypothetical protein